MAAGEVGQARCELKHNRGQVLGECAPSPVGDDVMQPSVGPTLTAHRRAPQGLPSAPVAYNRSLLMVNHAPTARTCGLKTGSHLVRFCPFPPLCRSAVNPQGLSFRALAALERDVAAALGAASFAQLGRGPSLLAGGCMGYQQHAAKWKWAGGLCSGLHGSG